MYLVDVQGAGFVPNLAGVSTDGAVPADLVSAASAAFFDIIASIPNGRVG